MAFALLALLFTAVPLCADGSRLSVGDIVSISVDGEAEMSKAYQLDRSGSITMPMIGPVKLSGMSTSDATAGITQALTKVLVNPQVTVTFVERAKMQVFVVGQVKTPGLITIGVGDRVVQALAQAGYDDTADLAMVSVRRGTQAINLDLTKYLKGEDLSVNIELESEDTIVVPQVDLIGYVMVNGQVERIGRIQLKRNMTFREAIGLAGGVTVEADTDNIDVKREGVAEPIKINYRQAIDGTPSADIVLQPGDTIYVKQLETSFFTVMGAVNKPGQYPLKGKLTLTEAIGLAGGTIPKVSDMKNTSIVRGDIKGKPSNATKINLNDVMSCAAEDPVIQRGDVIYVKDRKEKASVLQMIQQALPFMWIFK